RARTARRIATVAARILREPREDRVHGGVDVGNGRRRIARALEQLLQPARAALVRRARCARGDVLLELEALLERELAFQRGLDPGAGDAAAHQSSLLSSSALFCSGFSSGRRSRANASSRCGPSQRCSALRAFITRVRAVAGVTPVSSAMASY